MKEFDEMLECSIDETDSDGLNLKIKFKECFKPFLELCRADKESFYKRYYYVNLEGVNTYNLTDEQAFCIYSYTTSCSDWINIGIRYKQEMTICKKYYADFLDESLDKISQCSKEYIFRMDSPDQDQIQSWKKKRIGDTINIPHFLSTSKENWDEESTSTEWIIWRIKTLELNSKARDISNVTNSREEKEVLFKRNSCFMIEAINIDSKLIDLIEID